MTAPMGDREELGEQLNRLFNAFLTSDGADRMLARHALLDELWENKAGIITHLRAPAQCTRQSPLLRREQTARALFEVDALPHFEWGDVGIDKRERYLCLADAAIAAIRAPEAADAGAVAWQYRYMFSDGWSGWVDLRKDQFDKLSENVSCPYESRVLYASPTDAGMRERAAEVARGKIPWPLGTP